MIHFKTGRNTRLLPASGKHHDETIISFSALSIDSTYYRSPAL